MRSFVIMLIFGYYLIFFKFPLPVYLVLPLFLLCVIWKPYLSFFLLCTGCDIICFYLLFIVWPIMTIFFIFASHCRWILIIILVYLEKLNLPDWSSDNVFSSSRNFPLSKWIDLFLCEDSQRLLFFTIY